MLSQTVTSPVFLITGFCIVLLTVLVFSVTPMRHRSKIRTARKIYNRIQDMEDLFIIPYLRKIDPYVFEELVLLAFKHKGHKVYRNKRYSGDGGIDGKVKIDGKKVLIQDKRYKNYICLAHVQAFDEVCRKKHKKGYFIHTGKTGNECREIAWSSPRIEIISGQKLIDLLKKTNNESSSHQ